MKFDLMISDFPNWAPVRSDSLKSVLDAVTAVKLASLADEPRREARTRLVFSKLAPFRTVRRKSEDDRSDREKSDPVKSKSDIIRLRFLQSCHCTPAVALSLQAACASDVRGTGSSNPMITKMLENVTSFRTWGTI